MKHEWIKLPNGRTVRRPVHKISPFFPESELYSPIKATGFETSIPDIQPSINPQHRYNTKTFDIRKLNGSVAMILGGGSVGGYVSNSLGPAQMEQYIIDPKKVELKHTKGGRTIYDHSLVGLKKVYALKQKVERDYPGTIIKALPFDIREIPNQELIRMLKLSLLAIFAFDDPEEILRVSDLAYSIVEIIQVAMHSNARSGHVAISIPFVTPCLRCTLNIKGPQDIRRLDSEPANSLDIITVAQQAARIAMDIMYSKVTGQNITRWDPSKNLIYIANTKQELSPDGPGIHYEDSQRRPGCPICHNRR